MKKTIALFVITFMIITVLCACSNRQHGENKDSGTTEASELKTEASVSENKTTDSTTPTTTADATDPKSDCNININNTLFIGDSRTVGLMEYSGLQADFFADTGMSVYNIYDKNISVSKVGKLTLEKLLNIKKYNKIYVMLGINELGYNINNTIAEYNKLISYVKEKQPQAVIFIQKNLHITKSKSDSEKYINNSNLDRLNSGIAEFADGKTVFCIDVNVVFDDSNGALNPDKTPDNVHLYAKYYASWGNWIIDESVKKLKEANL